MERLTAGLAFVESEREMSREDGGAAPMNSKWLDPNTPEQDERAKMFWSIIAVVAALLVAIPLVIGGAIRAWQWMIP